MNHNRSGSKYNPPANWALGMSLITVIKDEIKRLVKVKLKPRKSLKARHYADHFTLSKRLHVVKLRGKGDHLTNGQRFAKNHKS